jgi:small-conductance mechanosensitive channel
MKRVYIIFAMLIPHLSARVYGADLLKKAGASLLRSSEKIFVEISEEKRTIREVLEKEKKILESIQQEYQDSGKVRLEEIDTDIAGVKVELSQAENNDLLATKLAILNELYQVLKDQYTVRQNSISILDEHSTLLGTYLDDADFGKFKKEHKFKEYLIYYSFNDVQYLHKMILVQEQRLAQLIEHEKNAHTELNHRKQGVAAAALAYKQKQDECEKAVKNSTSNTDTKHLIDLLNLEEQLYKNKQKLDELRLKEIERKVQLLETKKFIAEEQVRILRHELRRIKPAVRVTEADLTVAKEGLIKQRQEHIRLAEVYRKRLNVILAERQEKEKMLISLSKRYSIPLNADIDLWRMQPQDTISSYVGVCQVSSFNAYLLLLDTKRALIDVQGMLDDIKLHNERLQIQVKESFYKISAHKFATEEAITQEMQQYESPKADARANLSLYKAKMNEIDELLKSQREISDAIVLLRQDIQQKQSKLFRNAAKEYFTCLDMTAHAELAVKERIEVLKKINGVYASIIAEIEKTLRHINFIVTELNSITIWHRPDYAISWEGIKSVAPDLDFFITDIVTRLRSINGASIGLLVVAMHTNIFMLLLMLLTIFGLLGLFFILTHLSVYLSRWFLHLGTRGYGVFNHICMWIAALLMFVQDHRLLLAPWVCVMALLCMYKTSISPLVVCCFYLCSIPYALYVINQCKRFIVTFNLSHNYALIVSEFQHKFIVIMTLLMYITSTMALLREAFIVCMQLTNYSNSELPIILLAANFIIFQIALVLLISKQQIIGLIPASGDFWGWVRSSINRYYWLLLLMVMIVITMGNPYVGFGRLMIYTIRGFLYTSALCVAILWLYGTCKSATSRLFFIREGDGVRERFEHAKSWFGFLVIAFFLTCSFIAIFLIARIWDLPLSLSDMSVWLYKPLIADLKPPISISSLIHLISFVITGFIISYIFDHFVLDKIFDLLLIDMGVQYTITSITRYLIVIAAIFLGFQQVGLGSLVVYIVGALALGIGWILKEPISDFVAYFIILVQRPVKIGDYIQIDENTMGVVRRITPRALVLRRRNSTTIVVPNSYMFSRAITNWNYVRKYIAFDDISILVHFNQDPELVRQLLQDATEVHPKVLKNPRPIVRLDNFAQYGYQFMVRGFISDVYTLDQWDIASEIRLLIVKKLREHHIDIAIPVRAYAPYYEGNNQESTGKPMGHMPEGGNIKE